MGTEVIRYTQIGREDIRFGKGTFEVVLADGRKVTLNEVDVGAILNDSTLSSNRFTDYIHDIDYGVAGDNTADDTGPLQAFFDACKNKRGVLRALKYKTTSALTLDPAYSYHIEGIGYDDNGVAVTVINNTGTGHAISIDNSAGTANDNLIRLSNFFINGNQNSLDGIFASDIPGLRLDRIYSSNHGRTGIELQRCYNAELSRCVTTHNGQHGIWLNKQCNGVVLYKCIANSNSRSDGFNNISIVGTSSNENLGVTLIGCDASSAGTNPYTSVTTAYGIVVQYSHGVTVMGCYGESNLTQNTYADSTAKNLTFLGNYQQDGTTTFDTVDGLICENNTFTRVSTATSLVLAGAATKIRNGFNTFNGGTPATLDTTGVTGKYTPTNVTTDRTYDADTVAVAELADIVGTLIADLQANGVIQ